MSKETATLISSVELNELLEKFVLTTKLTGSFGEKVDAFLDFVSDAVLLVERLIVTPKSGEQKKRVVLNLWQTFDARVQVTQTIMDKWFIGAYNAAVWWINKIPFIRKLPSAGTVMNWLVEELLLRGFVKILNKTIWQKMTVLEETNESHE